MPIARLPGCEEKAIGGSSAVNGMIYVRGHPQDYDDWEAAGNTGWGWPNMLRAFKQIENHQLGPDEYRGTGGPLNVSIQHSESPLIEALLEAGESMGLPRREDLNRPDLEGIGHTPCTIWEGRRVSAADAFLKPARQRSNLTIVTGTLIHRILFDGKRAVGVSGLQADRNIEYRARHEVMLCAGAIHSPKILQLSGVGPARHLRKFGIDIVADLPGVGANLREHKLLMLQWRLEQALSLNHELSGWRLFRNAMTWLLLRKGPLSTTYDLNAFIRSRPEASRPDVQLTISAFSLDLAKGDGSFEAEHGINIFGYPLHTESAGELMIRSADPDAPLLIRANCLATEKDRRTTVDMTRFIRALARQPSLEPFLGEETVPGPAVRTDEEIVQACAASDSCAHAVGTCRMGADDMAVVDERLRVRGLSGLRVMDCSVMPTQVSGNTNGPVMAMAWRAADLILEDRAMR